MIQKSIRFYNYFVLDILKLAPLILIFFAFRLIMHSTVYADLGTTIEILSAYFMGFRFDLLIIGFIMIPIVFFRFFTLLIIKKYHLVNTVINIYLTTIISLIAIITFLSSIFYSLFQFNIRGKLLSEINYTIIEFFKMGFGSWAFTVTSGIIIFVFYYLAMWIWGVSLRPLQEKKFSSYFYFLIPFLMTALLARGTLAPHHLARKHCEINKVESLTQLCLNPVWTFFN